MIAVAYTDLRSFIAALEARQWLHRVTAPVDPYLEITEISSRLLARQGPAVLFTNVIGSTMPVLANLFGTGERVALAIGRSLDELEALGAWLAELRQPQPPRGMKDAWRLLQRIAPARHMPPRVRPPWNALASRTWARGRAPCQEVILPATEVDLATLPIPTCWPMDAGPLLTWPVVITQGPDGGPINLGIYRMQPIGRNRLIMRWLRHRGGAQHARQHEGRTMPVAVAIGCDPATLVAAVTPLPETLSEYAFAGLLRGKRVDVVPGVTVPLPVPAAAEIVLEGYVDLTDTAPEGPFGDHTGYYNEVERFPVFTVTCITRRRQPLFLTTCTGRPPDEPAMLALALNRVFVPLLRQQFPEIHEFHLPMEGCSYRLAIVSIKKQYPGHAFRVMVGIWGFLRQFLYTKYIIVVDEGVPVTHWPSVMAAIDRHVDARRDVSIIRQTPIDYLDFASPQSGLGSKLGLDATAKLAVEIISATPVPVPDLPQRASDWPAALRRMIPGILDIIPIEGVPFSVLVVDKREPVAAMKIVETVWRLVPPRAGADILWIVDPDIEIQALGGNVPENDPTAVTRGWHDLIWALVTRTDPARDTVIDAQNGRMAIDATNKLPQETIRHWGEPIRMSDSIVQRVTSRWTEYGFTPD